MPTMILTPVDLMNPARQCFLVWETPLTRQGINEENLAQERSPKRLIGARKTKSQAELLAAIHEQYIRS